ncbi:Trehalase [Mycobacterium basiliense]|uniref:Trehalase n=1 Tax=Mycobacterium basiliense TaxID=2094119 RepID=A0A447GBR6_9MYCO|nr:glycoside hydrolase family 15 protein [Mycobacterium basiliense]VDM87909.1 Trehalase [Mycobacterium basiliense]
MGAAAGTTHVLREYALLADGARGALIGPRGEISWMCAPRWDDDAVFSTLLGGRGVFSITPSNRYVWGGHYEEGTLIWRSRWVTTDSIIECREALAYPGDQGRLVLLRRLLAVQGDAHAELLFAPAAGFGHHGMAAVTLDDRGCWHADVGNLRMRLRGAADATATRLSSGIQSLQASLKAPEGGFHDIVAELSDSPSQERPLDAQTLWDRTEDNWRRAIPPMSSSIAVRDARHSYAVLRGLTSPSGGMVAAATMSLPERAEQGRNYDYRYVWIRDQCYAGQAVAVDEPHELLDSAVGFVSRRLLADGPKLRPAYTVDEGPVPKERSLRLPGYPGGGDMVGNHARDQFQLDTLGEALLLFAAAGRHDHLDSEAYQAVTTAVAAIVERWQDSDAGIWELDTRRWAHSRLTCVAGLRAIAAHAAHHDAATWSSLADTILADTRECQHPSGRWQRAPDDPRVDAALLIPAIRGAVPADDPRSIATLDAVCADLVHDGYVHRFRHADRPLDQAEGAFLLCGFWTALAYQQQGDMISATRYFERHRAACGPPGLYCEEYDEVQRQLRGNIPQAFVHALLIESSLRLPHQPASADSQLADHRRRSYP